MPDADWRWRLTAAAILIAGECSFAQPVRVRAEARLLRFCREAEEGLVTLRIHSVFLVRNENPAPVVAAPMPRVVEMWIQESSESGVGAATPPRKRFKAWQPDVSMLKFEPAYLLGSGHEKKQPFPYLLFKVGTQSGLDGVKPGGKYLVTGRVLLWPGQPLAKEQRRAALVLEPVPFELTLDVPAEPRIEDCTGEEPPVVFNKRRSR